MRFQRLAEKFAITGSGSLAELVSKLTGELKELDAVKADLAERVLVTHLENALEAGLFTLEQELENAFKREDWKDLATAPIGDLEPENNEVLNEDLCKTCELAQSECTCGEMDPAGGYGLKSHE